MAPDCLLPRRALVAGLLSLLLCAFAPAPLPKTDRSNGDLRKLQGEWDLVELYTKSEPPSPASPPLDYRPGVVIRANRMRELVGISETGDEWTISLNARGKALDRQDREGRRRLGVYELKDDVLTIYSRDSDEGRPTAHDLEKGPVRVEVYKRRKQ